MSMNVALSLLTTNVLSKFLSLFDADFDGRSRGADIATETKAQACQKKRFGKREITHTDFEHFLFMDLASSVYLFV